MVDLTGASWNLLTSWTRQIEGLHKSRVDLPGFEWPVMDGYELAARLRERLDATQ